MRIEMANKRGHRFYATSNAMADLYERKGIGYRVAAPVLEEDKPKRTYRRRDMKADAE
jgi:hypothetical protein